MLEHQKISICFDRMFCTPYLRDLAGFVAYFFRIIFFIAPQKNI